MRLATFKGEKTVNDLGSRLFRIRGRGSQAAMKQATDALLKANPQLKDLSKVPVGALITIPDIAPPIAPGEEVTSAAFVRSFAAQNVQAALDSLQQRLSDIETSALDQISTGMDRFQTTEVKTALKTAADADFAFLRAAPSLESIAKVASEISKKVKTAQDARKQVVTKVRTALSSFAKTKSEK
jgi:phage tail protein X